MTATLFRVYGPGDSFDQYGYPVAWQQIKHLARTAAGNRCERCGHPYVSGSSLNDGWSPCDDRCAHHGPVRLVATVPGYFDRTVGLTWEEDATGAVTQMRAYPEGMARLEARWRILTTHHLNGVKADMRWWNLAALCQRCHLTIQGKVVMDREFIREHTDWMKPHAAAFYAAKYLGEDLTREETVARLGELLALELREVSLF